MRKLELHLTPGEYSRLQRAARRRGLTAWEYVRQSTGLQVDLDLGARQRFEVDGFARRPVETYPDPDPR